MTKQPLTVHTFGMANYLMKNKEPMTETLPHKFKNQMVYYFEDTPKARRLMNEYTKQK